MTITMLILSWLKFNDTALYTVRMYMCLNI